ncbi:hypothetical protein BKK79_21170 [Cupriavidus sp. USMAA2-4]|uniref:LuxR C-terminal-related transcriptional regulator n=1 Tax=Cupriavidus sp. USMAA2-4 TaxID=876364 RepID=UPI0008A6BB35|nr:LuxR C-terminal-related transcriptional regulator [Cupriavidus sp. USMAA2-4]AOY94462.1 hypothetical protein BKK79_21170 [Cupriavidus sp. USMAA2-4]
MLEQALSPISVLDTKLNPPSASPIQVPRQEITDLVCEARSARLVLIRAPTGFGKTTVMLQCRNRLEELQVQTAWLTVDRADNDASRFLFCLGEALREIAPDESDTPHPQDAAVQIVSRLARCERPFALFIDEFETIHEPGVQGLLREIVANLPRRGQLIIGTRSVPNLALGRLRARGQLLEIDAKRLRFSVEETQDYLVHRRGIELPPIDLQRLHHKTEGWIAGLWLASAALAHQDAKAEFVDRFSGSNLAVADYLTEEVLNLQAAEVRSFLLRTSILKTLSPALCRMLVPGVDAEDLLRKLEAENILITRIDGEERSFRYHSLFIGFLRAQLARELPDEIPQLHRAAARWFESQQRPVPAIEHALEGDDLEHAIAMLEAHAMGLLAAGRMRLLSRWFENIPATALAQHARLQMIHLWALGCTHGPWDAMARMQASRLDQSNAPEVWPHVMALRPTLLAMMDRTEEAYAAGMQSLGRLPSGDNFADSVLLDTLAGICSTKGQAAEALRLLDLHRSGLNPHSGALTDMHSESVEGTIALFEGRMREATARFRAAVSATHHANISFTNGNAWAGMLYAATVYESNDLEQATGLLRVYTPLVRDVGLPDHLTLGYRMLSRIAFGAGDVDQSLRLLTELEMLGHQRQLPRVVVSARLERSRTQLLQGHIEASRDELRRASDPAIWAPISHLRLLANDVDYPALSLLRWEAFVGDAGAALQGLTGELDVAVAARRHHRALKLRLIRAVAQARSGDRNGALNGLSETLRDCCQEGFVRAVLDEGAAVGVLVRELFAKTPAEKDRAFAVWLQRLVHDFGTALPDPVAETTTLSLDSYLLDPLTRKELAVLQLLAEGYSNRAMADKLFVSINTVCTHVRNINGKFGVRSRMQAVSTGRALGLLR